LEYSKSFLIFVLSLNRNDMENYILTQDDAIKLFSLEEDDQSPMDNPYTDDDFNKFVEDVSGKTLLEYCEWRFPDSPEEQFELASEILFPEK
jgi:hypothetical protein